MSVPGKAPEGAGKKRKGLRTATFVIAAVGVCVAACVWTHVTTSRSERETIGKTQQHLMNMAKSQSQKIEEFIDHIQGEMEMLAANPAIVRHNEERLSQTQVIEMGGLTPDRDVFDHIKKHCEGDADSLYRIDKDGMVLARTPFEEGEIGDDYSHKPGVRYVMENKKPYVTEIFTTNSGEQAISVCHPVFDGEEFSGAVCTVVHTETLGGLISHTKVGEKGYAWLVDDRGVMLAHPSPDHEGKDVMALRKEAFPDHDWTDMERIVDEMKSGVNGVGVYHSAWWTDEEPKITKKLVAFTPVKAGSSTWSLAVSMGYDEIAAPIAKNARDNLLGAGFLLLLLGAGGLGFYRAEKKEAELEMLSRTAEELEEREKRFRSVAQTASDAIITIDSGGVITFWNDAARKIFGYPTGEALGRPVTLIIPERFHDAHEHGMKRLGATGEPRVAGRTVELVGLRKNGEEFPLDLSLAQWQTKEGSFYTGIVRDITNRKQAEDQLRASEERLRLTLDAVSDGGWDLDMRTEKIYYSDRWMKSLGYRREDVDATIDFWRGIVHPDDLVNIVEKLREHLEGRTPFFECEYRLRKKSGDYRWTLNRCKVVTRDADGAPLRIVGTDSDITARKRAEEALRESENRLSATLDTMPDMVYESTLDGTIVYANKAASEILGYSLEELGKISYTDLLDEEGLEVGMRILHELVEKKAPPRNVYYNLRAADGTLIPVEAHATLMERKGRQPTILGVARDITERKRAEEELSRIRAAVDDASDAIMISDGGGKAVYLNAAFGHLFGHTIESINLAGLESLYADRGASDEVLDRVGAGASWEGETRMNFAKSGEFEAFLRVSPILNNEFDVIGFLLICTDITERKRIEAEQIDRQKLQAIVELAGAACHELNQPIQVVSGHTELMLIRMSQDDSLRRQLETVKEQVDRMVRITRKLNGITSYETRSYFGDIRIIDIDKASRSVRTKPSPSGDAYAGAGEKRRGEAHEA